MDVCLLKALADPTRARIIELLVRRSYCVRALSQLLEMSESAVSQHLKVLRDADLVEGVKYGYYTHYRVRRETLAALRDQLLALKGEAPRADGEKSRRSRRKQRGKR